MLSVPRLLCLHGGGSSAAVMRRQTSKLRAALHSQVEFEFLQGEQVMPEAEVDPRLRAVFGDGPYFNWYSVRHDAPSGPEASLADYVDALCSEKFRFSYPGADVAMARLERTIREDGPYDGLLGFSQGAILITLLTATRLRSAGEGGEPPDWRCNALCAGMPVRANDYLHLFEAPLAFPSCLALGTADPFYPWASRLSSAYTDPDVIEFDEGHRFPHSKEATQAFAEAIRRRLGVVGGATASL
eukprot:1863636-Prymnesium_polylepis.1